MADVAYAFQVQAVWLRTWLRAYGHDLRFRRGVLRQLAQQGIDGLAVRDALKCCEFIDCEPDPAGSRWLIRGEEADGRKLWVRLEVAVPENRVTVVEVSV